MQNSSNSRSSQRSTTEPASQPTKPSNSGAGVGNGAGARTSSASSRSSTYRRQNPGQQLSQIEKSVTHLLVATKQLLETLTQWSRHNATEGEVSDVYVRLGYEFNIACRAFNGIGVDTSDLGPVPELLRAILEETLSQEASSASLDKFLPRIRDIIINLLHGLKRKQQRLRAKQSKDNPPNGNSFTSSTSSSSLNTGLTQMLEDSSSKKPGGRASERRTGSGSVIQGDGVHGEHTNGDDSTSTYHSATPTRQTSSDAQQDFNNRHSNRDSQRPFPNTSFEVSTPGPTTQISYGALTATEDGREHLISAARPGSQRDQTPFFQPPPPPPQKQQDALAILQRGGDLERRASRRYSAYQISKHLGASPNGMPMLPPTQNTPIPNRGREARDSMNAVRTRGSGVYSRQKSTTRTGESSPVRTAALSNRISEESTQSGGSRQTHLSAATERGDQLHDESRAPTDASPASDRPQMGASLSSPVESLPAYNAPGHEDAQSSEPRQESSATEEKTPSIHSDHAVEQFVPEQSPQPGKELTLFLQYKSKIKKFVLAAGSSQLSVARLQLAFIEKFAWNTHSNGNDLPDIYIQDPVSGVRHELEDLRDIKDRCVLVLNIEALDEVKKHIDEGLGGIRKLVEGVRNTLDSQHLSIQRVSDRQQDTSREVARLSTKPDSFPAMPSPTQKPKINGITLVPSSSKIANDQSGNIQSMRQDLAVVRQTFTSLVTDMNNSMANIQEKASSVKTIAIEGVVPSLDASTGRSYVNTGKKTLGEESEKIVNQVDDLQDIVEDLRKDVVTRGVRPLPRQLESVGKSISNATSELKKMQEFLRREKPIWTKIWEKELEVVCNDRDLLTMQEELATDLEDDLDKATQTFALVEQATKQQNLQSSQGATGGVRSASKGLAAIASAADQEVDPTKAKDGVLGEVRALRPNHETRLEAIERAERARRRELETRREGEFTKEVATFVEEGKLKKSGGVEETERLRKTRDERNMREAWVKQQERAADKGKEPEALLMSTQNHEDPSQSVWGSQPETRRSSLPSDHQGSTQEASDSEEEGERLIQGQQSSAPVNLLQD